MVITVMRRNCRVLKRERKETRNIKRGGYIPGTNPRERRNEFDHIL